MTFKSKKVYKRNRNKKISKRKNNKYSRKRMTKRGGMKPAQTARDIRLENRLSQPVKKQKIYQKIYQNHQNPIIPLQNRDIYVLGGDYGYSSEWEQILDEYPKRNIVKRFNKKSVSEIPEIIRAEMEKRKGKIRCPFGQISFNELPDYDDLSDDFPYNNLLKFVIVLDSDTNEFIIIWSRANILHIDYAEEYIKKYFDDSFKYLKTGNRKIPVYITPDIIEVINSEQQVKVPGFNLLWERSMNARNYNRIVTEYLTRTQGFNPATHIHLLPRPEVSHSCLANNFNGHNLVSAQDGRANIYGGFEAVIINRTIIVNDQSGHYQTDRNTLITLLYQLLESKGYTDLVILVPPPDKPHYRTYITNNPEIYLDAVSGTYNENAYNRARSSMRDANTDSNPRTSNQVELAYSQEE
jgi:hypothetical protein